MENQLLKTELQRLSRQMEAIHAMLSERPFTTPEMPPSKRANTMPTPTKKRNQSSNNSDEYNSPPRPEAPEKPPDRDRNDLDESL